MMWEKPHPFAVGVSRPLRVAYLIELENCPDELFEGIFAEAYGRWGGRRTLIVPATPDGIDERYADWLYYSDPDVIYSFVDLKEEAVLALHERYAPAHLVRHGMHGAREYSIELPVGGLTSLSVLPALLSRNWGYEGPPKNLRLLGKYWDQSSSLFLQENFGFLQTTFRSGSVGSSFPDLFTCYSLITPEALSDDRMGKEQNTTYVTSEDAVLDELGSRRPAVLTLPNLSEIFAPHINAATGFEHGGMNIVVGDSASDRMLFWNGHQRFGRLDFTAISSIRIPASRLGDEAFLRRVRLIVDHRAPWSPDGRRDTVTFRSSSLDEGALRSFSDGFKQLSRHPLSIRVLPVEDHAHCVPKFSGNRREISFVHGSYFDEPVGRASAEFSGRRISFPKAVPWHVSEVTLPPRLRGGNWMVDVTIDRLADHCKHVNRRHVWAFPRRLRIERAFGIEWDPERDSRYRERTVRPMRNGALGVAMNLGIRAATITTPEDDLQALASGLCSDYEWLPFDGRGGPTHRPRFYTYEVSDKGRYLLGVLQLFDQLTDSFAVLMHRYWQSVLQDLGGGAVERNPELLEKLITRLRRRLGQQQGPLQFESPEELQDSPGSRCGSHGTFGASAGI